MPVFGVDGFDDLASPLSVQDLIGLLDGEFANNRISDWNQTGRDDVGTGICMGMCLDWMRRILTGMSKTRIESRQSGLYSMSKVGSGKKNSYRWEEQKNTHKVFQKVQSTVVANWREEQELTATIQRIRQIDPAFANVNTLDEARQVANQGPPGLDMHRWNAMENGLVQEMQTMLTNLGQPIDPREALRVRMLKQTEILDTLASVDSSIIPRYTLKWTRTHAFGGLRVDGNTAQLVQAPMAETTFLRFVQGELARLDGDRCGVLSMGRFGASGHDVAFYVGRNRGFFSYFDPTMGEFYFSANQWTELGKLLCASWRAIYGKKNYDWVSWTNYAARA